jgi:hypothetical protein
MELSLQLEIFKGYEVMYYVNNRRKHLKSFSMHQFT